MKRRWIAFASTSLGVAALAASAASAPASRPFPRGCSDAVFGDIGKASRWHSYSAVSGPLALIGLRDAAHAKPAAIRAAYRKGQGAFKVLAIVLHGRAVTVSVPVAERRHVALLYDGSRFQQPQTVANGERAVTFRACPPAGTSTRTWREATQWAGGVVVDGPRCVTLDVRVLPHGPSRTVRQAFGPVRCPPS
jgi:hypothetical protein